MPRWIKLDAEALNKPHHENIRGVDVEVFLSPYDVPEAVRGLYDDTIERFVIEFRYLAEEEPLAADAHDAHVALKIGRNSRRLYRIEMDVNRLKADCVALRLHVPQLVEEVDEALEKLARTSERVSRRGNYQLAKDVIAKTKEELFEPLCTH